MGDVNLEIKLSNIDERVIKIEESGGGSGGDSYITSVSNDFNVVNKNLSLSNDVTTKLSKVDTPDNLSVELAKKINKPASATNGQVLTYNSTSNEWEAQDSKGADDTSIISDAYDELKLYVVGEYCIYNNSLWKCLVQNNGQTPTESTYWTNVSVASELTQINNNFGSEPIYLGGIQGSSTITIELSDNISNYRYIMMCLSQNNSDIAQIINPVYISAELLKKLNNLDARLYIWMPEQYSWIYYVDDTHVTGTNQQIGSTLYFQIKMYGIK